MKWEGQIGEANGRSRLSERLLISNGVLEQCVLVNAI